MMALMSKGCVDLGRDSDDSFVICMNWIHPMSVALTNDHYHRDNDQNES